MSIDKDKGSQLVKAISERFLKEGKEFFSIADILEAPVSTLKKIDAKAAKLLEEGAFITKIGDLVELDPQKPFISMLQGRGETEDPIKFSMLKQTIIDRMGEVVTPDLMRDAIIAARLIARSEKKEEFYIKDKKEQKIMFLGLDNAGKTAIINVMSGRINPSSLRKLRPTKKVQREKIVTKDFQIYVWDMGGQEEYRDAYLKKENLEMFFLQVDMLVYVIDMQDMGRLPQSLAYLAQILDTLKYLGENPFVLIFLHKADPDIIDDPEFQMNIESVKDGLLDLMKKFQFDYDAYPTSIYYLYSREAKFTGFIKGVLDEQKESETSKKDPVKAMGEVLDTAMNLTVNLANTMQDEFERVRAYLIHLEQRIVQLEQAAHVQPAAGPAQAQAPSRPPVPATSPSTAAVAAPLAARPPGMPAGINPPPGAGGEIVAPVISSGQPAGQQAPIRATMMDELKAIFAKRRAALQ